MQISRLLSVGNGNNSVEEDGKSGRYIREECILPTNKYIAIYRLKLYSTVIRPVITYAVETWVMKETTNKSY